MCKVDIRMEQSVAILVDGNNIEMGIRKQFRSSSLILNYDTVIPKILGNRGLNRLKYFREGVSISPKFAERLHENFHGTVRPCYKSADIPLTIAATQLADKVDTIVIMSGDSDYLELVKHLKHKGVRVEVVCFQRAASDYLLKEVDHYYFITREDLYELKPKTDVSQRSDTGHQESSGSEE